MTLLIIWLSFATIDHRVLPAVRFNQWEQTKCEGGHLCMIKIFFFVNFLQNFWDLSHFNKNDSLWHWQPNLIDFFFQLCKNVCLLTIEILFFFYLIPVPLNPSNFRMSLKSLQQLRSIIWPIFIYDRTSYLSAIINAII